MANTKVTTGVIKDDAVGADQLASNSVVTASIVDNAITTAKINNDAILTAKISNSAVTNAKLAANSVDSDQYVDGSIDTAHIADGQITSAKLDTNISVSGTLTVGSHLSLGDSDEIRIGDSSDLKIYHSGSHSFIDEQGTGGLITRTSDFYLRNPSDADMIYATSGGVVKLYYAGAEKLATTSSGIDVTGRLDVNLTGAGDAVKITGNSITDFDFVGNPPEFNLEDSSSTSGTKRARITVNDNQLQICSLPDDDTSVTNFLFYANLGNGNCGIGNDSPNNDLTIGTNLGSGYVISAQTSTPYGLVLQTTESTPSANAALWVRNDDDGTVNTLFRVNNNGNVGIGRTDPTQLLEVHKSTGGDQTVAKFSAHNYGDTGKTFIEIGTEYGDGSSRIGSFNDTGNSSVLVFDTHSSTSGAFDERFRVASNGNFGINTIDVGTKLHVRETGATIASGNAIEGSTQKGILLENTANDSTSLGLWYSSPSGNHQAGISFQRNDHISTWGTDIRFYTHENATVNVDYARERMKITSEGEILHGISSPVSNATTTIYKSSLDYGLFIRKGDGTTGATNKYIGFDISGGGTTGGSITNSSAGNAQFTSTSDERLKENIEDINGCLDKVMALKPSSYTLKENNLDVPYGFIAQNVETVLPEFVSENEEGYKQISDGLTSGYIAVLTKAIQEQQEQIETLKQEIQELKE